MSDYFLGEIRVFSFSNNYRPRDWANCDGATMPLQQNPALGALLGKQFGGDGTTTFKLPDLRGRAIVGAYMGGALPANVQTRYLQGVSGQVGVEAVTLTEATVPPHTHTLFGSSVFADSVSAANAVSAPLNGSVNPYFADGQHTAPLVALDPASVSTAGGSQSHANMQPFLTLNVCIALTGLYPPRD